MQALVSWAEEKSGIVDFTIVVNGNVENTYEQSGLKKPEP